MNAEEVRSAPRVDVTREAQLFLRAVADCGGKMGLSTASKVLVGAAGLAPRLQKSASFKAGAGRPLAWWSRLGGLLRADGLLDEVPATRSV